MRGGIAAGGQAELAWMEGLPELEMGSDWDEALGALAGAGFQTLSVIEWRSRAWKMADPMGPLPEALGEGGISRWALLAHRSGVVLAMVSTSADGEGRSLLDSARLSWQAEMPPGQEHMVLELGSMEFHPKADSMRTILPRGDGGRILARVLGASKWSREDGALGDGLKLLSSIGDLLRVCSQSGRVAPVERWEAVPGARQADSRFYSPGPCWLETAHDEALAERMAPRLEADRQAFVAALPQAFARLGLPGNLMNFGRGQFKLATANANFGEIGRRDGSVVAGCKEWNEHVAEVLDKLARQATTAESKAARGWCEALDEAAGPFDPPEPSAIIFGSSNVLHAMAASDGGEGVREETLDWLGARAPGEVDAWAGMEDAAGWTPVELALREAMRSRADGDKGLEFAQSGLLGWMLGRGLAGEPGRLASRAWSLSRELPNVIQSLLCGLGVFAALHAAGKDWAAPLRKAGSAPIEDEADAMEALAKAFTHRGWTHSAWLAAAVEAKRIEETAAVSGAKVRGRPGL